MGNMNTVLIEKDNLKVLSFDKNMVSLLRSEGIRAFCSFKERLDGINLVTTKVLDSGVLPKMKEPTDLEFGKSWSYIDASGNWQKVIDVDSFFNDIASDALEYGINANQFKIAVQNKYGYRGDIVGTSKEGMDLEIRNAFLELESVKENDIRRGSH